MIVSAEDLRPGDVLANGSVIQHAWVATNPRFVMIELEGGGIRTYYRYTKFNIERNEQNAQ